jgi:hypothetical protein
MVTTMMMTTTTTMTDDDDNWAGWPPPYPSTDISRLETKIVENIRRQIFPKTDITLGTVWA